ncbi:MAG TPA: hypothetical protein VIN59_08050 [Alphaproteobacteria bacterium]
MAENDKLSDKELTSLSDRLLGLANEAAEKQNGARHAFAAMTNYGHAKVERGIILKLHSKESPVDLKSLHKTFAEIVRKTSEGQLKLMPLEGEKPKKLTIKPTDRKTISTTYRNNKRLGD